MTELRRFLMWATLVLLVVLTVCSIYGAFIGAERAQAFFNSVPLAVYWFGLFLALMAGFLAFKRLRTAPTSFCIHAGCVAVLIGGLWGSGAGRELQNRILGRNIIPDGRMALVNGQRENRIYLEQDPNEVRELPFMLALDEFRIEHYPGKLHIQDRQSQEVWILPVAPGAAYDLGPPHGYVHITGVYENFKIRREFLKDSNGNPVLDPNRNEPILVPVPYDDPGPGSNPALAVQLHSEARPRYVFERHPGHTTPDSPLVFQYRKGMISDYISEIKVIEGDAVVAQKDIEVNHPLYYGGYHFYQSSYGQDPQSGQMYTVLSVVPYTGLYWVYLGYILLCGGVAWQCWFCSIRRVLKQGVRNGN
jgi:hypothetical protein